jgi:plastocyanin
MLFSSVFTSALLLAGTSLAEGVNMRQNMPAQTSSSNMPSGTMSAQAPRGSDQVKMTVVKVGSAQGDITFSPNNLRVDPGTMVQFQFWPKVSISPVTSFGDGRSLTFAKQNHSVVRSSFSKPCMPIEESTPGATGFFSGFMPIQQTLGIFTILVNDTKPIWFYCSQYKHCQSGMVGVINA